MPGNKKARFARAFLFAAFQVVSAFAENMIT
jgi:hypothetical protein